MMFFISTAFADGGAAQQSGGGWISILPMVAFVGILYFLLIRPQQKRAKQHQALVSAIKKGDKVITNSGIVATVSKILNDQEVVLEIADGVYCRFIRSTIASIIDGKVNVCDTSKTGCCSTGSKKESAIISNKAANETEDKADSES